MEKRGKVFWDVLPLVIVIAVVCGSLFFVDFTGMVVVCDDVDVDGYCGTCTDTGSSGIQTFNVGNDVLNFHDVDGSVIVFEGQQDYGWGVYSYDISSQITTALAASSTYLSQYPVIENGMVSWIAFSYDYGRKVAYKDTLISSTIYSPAHGCVLTSPDFGDDFISFAVLGCTNEGTDAYDILLYDISTGQEKLFSKSDNQMFPTSSGSKTVFQDNSAGNYDIYQIATPGFGSGSTLTQVLISGAGNQQYPRISGDNVVYQSDAAGEWDVLLYGDGSFTNIAIESGVEEKYPDISGDYIVWSDNREGGWNIYLYDLSSDIEYAVTTGASNNNILPRVGSDYIVWKAEGSGSDPDYFQGITIVEAIGGEISGETCGSLDCDDTNSSISPGEIEICDGIDNDCDGEIDEFCDGEVLEDSGCFLSVSLQDELGEYITEASSFETIYVSSEGDGTCVSKAIAFDVYSTTYDEESSRWVKDVVIGTEEGIYYSDEPEYDLFYAAYDLTGLDDGYYVFVADEEAGSLDSETLTVCADLNNCVIGDVEEEVVEEVESVCDGCLLEGESYFADETSIATSLLWGNVAYLFSLNDGTCGSVNFHMYEIVDNGDGTYVTGDFVETMTPEIISYEDASAGLMYGALVEWDTTSYMYDSYYYFIVEADNCATYSDSVYLCSIEPCDYSAIIISDAATIAASYYSETEEIVTEEVVVEEEEDCASQWDCTGVEWEECDAVTGTQFRDLTQCVLPTDETCLQEEYWPEYEVSCVVEGGSEVRDVAEVPVFGFVHMLIVVFLLGGYYTRKIR